jgi:uncharacterized protein
MYISRKIAASIRKGLSQFPVLTLTGPRQSGKTTLLREEFSDYRYVNLERPDIREMVALDPIGFLRSHGEKVIFDEAQRLPELFSYIQVLSDERNTVGQYILSGSQSFLLNEHISQSLAGRVSIHHLFPFDLSELEKNVQRNCIEEIFRGYYPRLRQNSIPPEDYYPSYIQSYIERDLRTLSNIGNLNQFSRFLGLCAGRIGQVLNLSSLANDSGITVNTAKSWLSILSSSFIIFLLQPYYENFSRRLIKSPKLYFYDTGVAASLLRIHSPEALSLHYSYGHLFENHIIAEILKIEYHQGRRPNLWFWRDSNGAEIDLLQEKNGILNAIEIKAGETLNRDYFKNLYKFPPQNGTQPVKRFLIYAGNEEHSTQEIQIIPYHNLTEWLYRE